MTKIWFEYNYDDCDDEENEGDVFFSMESAGLTKSAKRYTVQTTDVCGRNGSISRLFCLTHVIHVNTYTHA